MNPSLAIQPAPSPLGVHLLDLCVRVFLSNCPSADEWVKSMWCACAVSCRSALKGDWAKPLVEMGMAPETQSEVSQKSSYCISTHIRGVKKMV